MFGDTILAAPILESGKLEQEIYLPGGENWFDLTNNILFDQQDGRFRIKRSEMYVTNKTQQEGGKYVKISANLVNSLPPLMVRAGGIISTADPSIDVFFNTTDPNVVSLESMSYIIHFWVFPDKTKGGWSYTNTWDGAWPYTYLKNSSSFVWNITDSQNRLYTT